METRRFGLALSPRLYRNGVEGRSATVAGSCFRRLRRHADPNDLINARFNLALKERDYHAAERILESPGGNEFDDDGFFYTARMEAGGGRPRPWGQRQGQG